MKAINPKYQRQVEKAAKLLAKYNDLDNKRNEADGLGDDKLVDKLDKQCERVFNQYLEAEEGLPSREVKVINDYVYGKSKECDYCCYDVLDDDGNLMGHYCKNDEWID